MSRDAIPSPTLKPAAPRRGLSDLTGASLLSARLARADLTNANLANATLRGTSLLGADLTSADLATSSGSAFYYANTNFADTGFDPVARGWVLVPEPRVGVLQLAVLISLACLVGAQGYQRRRSTDEVVIALVVVNLTMKIEYRWDYWRSCFL